MTDTYTNRTMGDPSVVKRIGAHGSLESEDGWGFGGHPSLTVLVPGDVVELEHHGVGAIGRPIVGVRRRGGEWLYRKTDQQIEDERAAMLAGFDRRRREQLDENRYDWTAREAALPEWLRDRLATFHERGGEHFELDGWGYELVICELAALYAADGAWVEGALPIDDAWERLRVPDPEPVAKIAAEQGTSGNQHQVAQALALAHVREPDRSLGGTRSALTPLTGDPDYSGERPMDRS